jgi:hypothetical protein
MMNSEIPLVFLIEVYYCIDTIPGERVTEYLDWTMQNLSVVSGTMMKREISLHSSQHSCLVSPTAFSGYMSKEASVLLDVQCM